MIAPDAPRPRDTRTCSATNRLALHCGGQLLYVHSLRAGAQVSALARLMRARLSLRPGLQQSASNSCAQPRTRRCAARSSRGRARFKPASIGAHLDYHILLPFLLNDLEPCPHTHTHPARVRALGAGDRESLAAAAMRNPSGGNAGHVPLRLAADRRTGHRLQQLHV